MKRSIQPEVILIPRQVFFYYSRKFLRKKNENLEHAEALCAAMNDDNVRFMTAQSAMRLSHPRGITRDCNPNKDAVLRQMGPRTIYPTVLAAEKTGTLPAETEKRQCISRPPVILIACPVI